MSDQEKMQNLLQELIGSKVELGIANGLYKGNYASRLEDLSPPAKDGSPLLGVAHPMFKGALLPMARNLDLNLRIESSGYFYQKVESQTLTQAASVTETSPQSPSQRSKSV